MRLIRSLSPWLFSALLLSACGGGDPDVAGSGSPSGAPTSKGSFSSIVVFGDSLSDDGAYSPATSEVPGSGNPPFFGGRFTTNATSTAMGGPDPTTPTGKIWVDLLAASLNIVVTPAQEGFGASSVMCPAAALGLGASCTDYAQGGSRVTDPNGINHAQGALTVPVVTQIANHLARFGSFKSSDLIFVYAGSNDVFVQFGTFAATAATIQAQAAAGTITADQANQALFLAQQTAEAGMKQAAQELVADIETQILAKGGQYVAVMELSDISDTPLGNTEIPPSARPVLTALSQTFNLWLHDGLTGQPVQIIGTYALFKDVYTNPATYGFTDVTSMACDPAKDNGSSLFCNATPGDPYFGLRAGANINTWLFADDVHPTTGGHKALFTAFTAALKSFGWI
ncbi:MAG: SGNH/GDSL hydrolase family protein [Pseudomonadota bacterium]|nr:SGNH/GDSL hydrolase family protein [Pseudomonadota bacterium]